MLYIIKLEASFLFNLNFLLESGKPEFTIEYNKRRKNKK